jgi:hypothetical protein
VQPRGSGDKTLDLSNLQPAMLKLPTSTAAPEHHLMPGSEGVGAQPRAAGDRDMIGTSTETRGEAMLTDFYVAFATVCFTLLGLWIIVVQTRHAEWRHSAVHRRRAYGVALHFSLPGLMTLLSLIDPASTALWRISFAIVAAGGVLALALVRGPAPTGLGVAAYVVAVVLYVLIALVAVAPGMVAEIGVRALPLRVEAVLLTMLVFLGVNVAWLLLFEEAQPAVRA